MLHANNAYKIFQVLVIVLICTVTKAQRSNFIHIQSENNQPYNVQWKGSTYNSSATGYLVIPQVGVGDHTLIIGFPRNLFPEYAFSCSVADKPRGFSLRQAIDNSWSLFDMVDFTVTKGSLASKDQVLEATGKLSGPVMAQSSMEEVPTRSVGGTAINKDPVATVSRIQIQKIFDKASAAGIDQVYIVVNGMKADTVALFIPVLQEDKPKQSAATGSPSYNSGSKGPDTGLALALIPRMVHLSNFQNKPHATLFPGTSL